MGPNNLEKERKLGRFELPIPKFSIKLPLSGLDSTTIRINI